MRDVRPVVVLMVDDDTADAELTLAALEDSKMLLDFHHVGDGLECMQFLRKEGDYAEKPRPDVVLLDLNMPRQGGLETLKQIRADPEFMAMPVVVLTTSDADQDVLQSYQLHANCYVTKPVDLDQFMQVVQKLEDFWFQVVRLPGRA